MPRSDPLALRQRIRHEIEPGERKRRYVRRLFGRVARKYDLTNDVMSLGAHRRWKRLVLGLAEIGPEHVVLDLAAGTGDLALAAARSAVAPIRVIAADMTGEMLQVGRTRPGASGVRWVQCDALELPMKDKSVDRIVIGYGLRNFARLGPALREIYRCLKPGGRLVALDFGRPSAPILDRAYLRYLEITASAAGWLLHRDRESYLYIAESLRQYPGQREVTEGMKRLGFVRCGYLDLLFGAMAINFGDRPGKAPTPAFASRE